MRYLYSKTLNGDLCAFGFRAFDFYSFDVDFEFGDVAYEQIERLKT